MQSRSVDVEVGVSVTVVLVVLEVVLGVVVTVVVVLVVVVVDCVRVFCIVLVIGIRILERMSASTCAVGYSVATTGPFSSAIDIDSHSATPFVANAARI